MKTTEVKAALGSVADTVAKRNGVFIAKRTFFYTHGVTPKKVAEAVQKQIPQAEIIEAAEHWNSWPKDSYWEVRFTV